MQNVYNTADEFFSDLNRERLASPGKWIFYAGTVAGRNVELKTYGASYLQIFRIDGIRQELPAMDCKVSVWKNAILSAFTA
jgi:hypothetical protein